MGVIIMVGWVKKIWILIAIAVFFSQNIQAESVATENLSIKPVASQSASSAASSQPATAGMPPATGVVPVANVSATPTAVPNMIPAPPDFNVKSYILVDANSGYVIAEKNADVRVPPASITKLMTIYLIDNALKNGQIKLTDQVRISENAWRIGGSKMFIRVGTTIPVQQLVNGVIVASGNDATVAMAEYIGGTEPSFAKMMNQTAKILGMNQSNFSDSNGLPAPEHYSSARDISILARGLINDFPEYYPWFKQKWIEFNGIKQPNRNRLLWRDASVDGLKTGHTDEAGYCLAASAVRGGMRLVSVIMGAPSDESRANFSEALLNYGFRFFETHKLFAVNTPVTTRKVWLGKESAIQLGVKQDLYVTIPVGKYQDLQANAEITGSLKAPIAKGQVCGKINVVLDKKIIATAPLVALQDDPSGNVISRFFGHILMLFHRGT